MVKFTMPTRIVIPPIQVFELAWLMVGKLITLFVTAVLATYCIRAKSVYFIHCYSRAESYYPNVAVCMNLLP